LKDKRKISNQEKDKDHIDEMKEFIKSKKEENEVLKKIIEKLDSRNNNKNEK